MHRKNHLTDEKMNKIIKKNEKEEFIIGRITEPVRKCLDINKTLDFICKEISEKFNIQRVSFFEIKETENEFNWNLRKEYKSRQDIKGISEVKITDDIKNYWEENLYKNSKEFPLIIENIEKSDAPDSFKKSYNEMGVKSIIVLPLKIDSKNWGILGLSIYDYYKKWDEAELIFFSTIANHISIAIKHAESFFNIKKQAEKETILREITTNIRNYFDINELKSNIVNSIGKILNTDRCYIREIDEKSGQLKKINPDFEYLSNKKIKSVSEIDNHIKALEQLHEIYKTDVTEIFYVDGEDYLKRNNLEKTYIAEYFNSLNIKNIMILPIYDSGNLISSLVIQYQDNIPPFVLEDIGFLRTVADQVSIAIKHSKLFNDIKQQAQRENLLRKVTETIIGSINIDEICQNIVDEVCKVFNADRCLIKLYKAEFEIKNHIECLASEDINSLKDIYLGREAYNKVKNLFIQQKIVINPDNDTNPDVFASKIFKKMNIKSNYAFSIFNDTEVIGFLAIDFVKNKVNLTEEDIEVLKTITNQAGIAIKQAELFLNLNKQLEKEKKLRSDDSILINKRLSKSIGLNSAISYSALVNKYNYLRDEKKLLCNDFVECTFDEIKNITFLNDFEQNGAIAKLDVLGLIKYKNKSKNSFWLKIIDDQKLLDYYLSDSDFNENIDNSNEIKSNENIQHNINELSKIYSNYFSKALD